MSQHTAPLMRLHKAATSRGLFVRFRKRPSGVTLRIDKRLPSGRVAPRAFFAADSGEQAERVIAEARAWLDEAFPPRRPGAPLGNRNAAGPHRRAYDGEVTA